MLVREYGFGMMGPWGSDTGSSGGATIDFNANLQPDPTDPVSGGGGSSGGSSVPWGAIVGGVIQLGTELVRDVTHHDTQPSQPSQPSQNPYQTGYPSSGSGSNTGLLIGAALVGMYLLSSGKKSAPALGGYRRHRKHKHRRN